MSDSSQIVQLSHRFEDVDMDHLVVLIADMLQRLIIHNDRIPLSPESLTRFHSRSPPAISVLEYLQRIVKYTNVERTCLIIILHYIDQMCARVARFTISSLTVHRFLISSITVSSKALCDVFCKNSYYARVGGLRVVELNILEKELLAFLDWRLTCTRDLLQEYYANLVRTHSTGLFRLSEEPISTPSNIPPDSPKHIPRSETITPVQGTDSDETSSGTHTVLAPGITPMTIAEPSNVLMGKAPGHIASSSPHVQQGVTTLEKNMAFAALHSPENLPPHSPRVEKRSNAHFTELLEVPDIRPSKRQAGDIEN